LLFGRYFGTWFSFVGILLVCTHALCIVVWLLAGQVIRVLFYRNYIVFRFGIWENFVKQEKILLFFACSLQNTSAEEG